MQDDLKEKDEFIIMFKIVLDKIASAARNLLNPPPPPKQERRPLPFLLSFILLIYMARKIKSWFDSSSCKGTVCGGLQPLFVL